ncbi:MAG: rhomboid family intramembrane serine protease [Alphaproteobacteria bacterium]
MAKKNGHDDSENENVTRFPDPRERKEIEHRLRAANDRLTPKGEPILNLPPTIKNMCIVLLVVHAVIALLDYLPQDWHGTAAVDWHGTAAVDWIIGNFGFYVLRYTGDMPFSWQGIVSPVSHMLLHGGWLHLAVNVTMFAAFGAGLERVIGGRKLVVLFLVTGIIGAFAHALIYMVYGASGSAALFPHPEAPLVGASGGISGLFGGVLMMAHDKGLMGGYKRLAPFVAIWILISLFFGFFGMPGAEGPIAWTTHIGGFVAGLLLYRPVARSKIFN